MSNPVRRPADAPETGTGFPPAPRPRGDTPSPQLPAPTKPDEAWKLKLRLLRQRLVERLVKLSSANETVVIGERSGLVQAIHELDTMLGQSEEERLK